MDRIEAYVLYPQLGAVMCGRKRNLNGTETIEKYNAVVRGGQWPAVGTKVTLVRDTLAGQWVVT